MRATAPAAPPPAPLALQTPAGPVAAAAWKLRVPVLACGGLCAAGAALGLSSVAAEVALHSGTAAAAVRALGVSGALGLLVGLWLPRRVVRAHLPEADAPAPVEFEFAATFSGALVLLWAVAWLLVFALAAGLEAWRAALRSYLLVPPELLRWLVLLPALAGLFLLGGGGTLVLVALHGWHRLVNRDQPRIILLWVTILLAAATGAGSAFVLDHPALIACVALLAVFGAGGLAVAGRVPGRTLGDPPRDAPRSRTLIQFLVAAGAASAAWGALLGSHVAGGTLSAATAGRGLCVLIGAVLLGVAFARAAVKLWPGAARRTPLLAGTMVAIAIARGVGAPLGSPPFVVVSTVAAAVVVVLVGRVVARRLGRVQPALAALGTSVAGGLTVGLLAAPWIMDRGPRPTATQARWVAAVRDWLTAGNPHTLRVSAAGVTDRAWLDVDLYGAHWDLILLQDRPDWPLDSRSAARGVERCRAALRPGGRLMLEGPAAELLMPTLAAWPMREQTTLVRVHCPDGEYVAAAFGPHIDIWLSARPAPDGWSVSVSPVRLPP